MTSAGNIHATRAYDALCEGKVKHRGNLNFSAYRQGQDPQYLGVNGAYWKRVYCRENVAARFWEEDKKAEKAKAEQEARATPPMRKSQSVPAMQRLPDDPPKDAYAEIKESMRPFAERQGKPRIRAMEHGERLHFFNTLDSKYQMKAGGKNLTWNVSKETHRSTPTELRWILSNYFRTDTQAVLAGAGSEPAFKTANEAALSKCEVPK
eukprot:CAMPEP_0206520198 /NCGR_PEP_ID=MMETSP0324_2-20121206/65626_1 /ASSEMBLY_ACC=CAM_ASM_000836 /TAXON_ID=2866 /ORGANISM="Crypthecodinium cohnii, Strain Seligo" /LENGTH=207 /DNA_ID=CAMNT_0054013889 /DNA_START=1 /DNA_END=622 /DNA_ORIENTATION=+